MCTSDPLDEMMATYKRDAAESKAHQEKLSSNANTLINGWKQMLQKIVSEFNKKNPVPFYIDITSKHAQMGGAGSQILVSVYLHPQDKPKSQLIFTLTEKGDVACTVTPKSMPMPSRTLAIDTNDLEVCRVVADYFGTCLRCIRPAMH